MKRTPFLLICSQDSGIVQRLLQIAPFARRVEQQRQRIAGDAALVGFNFVRAIGLRAAIFGQRQ